MQKLIINKKNCLQGFIENIRDKNTIAFIIFKNSNFKLQITINKEKINSKILETLKKLTIGTVITVKGILLKNNAVKLNGLELIPDSIKIESLADAPIPIQDDSNIDTKLDYRWLDLRSEKNTLIFKVQTLLVKSLREFVYKKDFIEIHTPKIIATASESGSEVFEVNYFDNKAYLAQSPQFYKQLAIASGFSNVFEVGPVFRAEKSHTNKHATEFTGFDIEFANIKNVKNIMDFEAKLLTYAITKVAKKYNEEIKRLFSRELTIPKLPFPVMKLNDVYKELKTRYNYEVSNEELGDLSTEAERLCKKLAKDKFNHEFLFVTDYDASKRAFYHERVKGIPQGFDLI
jgi:aspartyl-tRNA synthetase